MEDVERRKNKIGEKYEEGKKKEEKIFGKKDKRTSMELNKEDVKKKRNGAKRKKRYEK